MIFLKIWIIKTVTFFFCCMLVHWLDLTHSLSMGQAGLELTMWFRLAFTWHHRCTAPCPAGFTFQPWKAGP